jgi:hypothetical protein
MRIRWTLAAAADLERIKDYLQEHYPHLARPTVLKRVAHTLVFHRACGFSFKFARLYSPAIVHDQEPQCGSR